MISVKKKKLRLIMRKRSNEKTWRTGEPEELFWFGRCVRAAQKLVADPATLAEAAEESAVHRGRIVAYGVLSWKTRKRLYTTNNKTRDAVDGGRVQMNDVCTPPLIYSSKKRKIKRLCPEVDDDTGTTKSGRRFGLFGCVYGIMRAYATYGWGDLEWKLISPGKHERPAPPPPAVVVRLGLSESRL